MVFPNPTIEDYLTSWTGLTADHTAKKGETVTCSYTSEHAGWTLNVGGDVLQGLGIDPVKKKYNKFLVQAERYLNG